MAGGLGIKAVRLESNPGVHPMNQKSSHAADPMCKLIYQLNIKLDSSVLYWPAQWSL